MTRWVKIRFTKVKQRQLNMFNNLLNKKEGNITNSPLNLASQTGAHLPPGEGGSLSQAGSQAGAHLPPGEGGSLSQAGSQAFQAVSSQPSTLPSLWGRKQLSSTGHSVRQAGRCSPSLWGRR